MAVGQEFTWDEGLDRLAAAAPGVPFAIVVEPGRWQIFRWDASAVAAASLFPLGRPSGAVSALPVHLGVAGFVAESLQELAEAVGGESPPVGSSSRRRRLRQPVGIDGARLGPGVRPAPVLDPGPGVVACMACAGRGIELVACSCQSSGAVWYGTCPRCDGRASATLACAACSGEGSFLWPATIRICRRDGLAGPAGDVATALDVSLGGCRVAIERSVVSSGNYPVWQDHWVVDVGVPFAVGCRDLGVEWPDAVVWVAGRPAAGVRVLTAFTLLRMATVSPIDLKLQSRLGKWAAVEGPSSPDVVLDPERLGMDAASVVARLSRGAVDVTPMPALDELLNRCHDRVAAVGMRLAVACAGPEISLLVLSADLTPRAVIAQGVSMADVLLQAAVSLER